MYESILNRTAFVVINLFQCSDKANGSTDYRLPTERDAGCRLGPLGNNNPTTVSGFKDIERSPFTLDFLQNLNQGGKVPTRRIH